MKRVVAVLALLAAFGSAYAEQEVILKDYPPLKPLHNCKHPDGKFAFQAAPCGSDTTEFSSIRHENSDGTWTYLPLGATMNDTPNTASTPAPTAKPAVSDNEIGEKETSGKEILGRGLNSWLKLLGFAFIAGITATLLGGSFWRWFFAGIVLHFILVSLNVLSF